MIRRVLAAAGVALTALTLAGCATTVSLTPADAANDPACAAVTVRLPDVVDGQQRRWTDAQATGSWGDPTTVILTCGVDAPGPSTLPCLTVDGVDWIIDDTEAPNYRFTTFGREPAVEVYLDYDAVSGQETLTALATAVGTLPVDGSVCTDRATG
ncbi:DUF3515 domain-containing protein [Microbacterium terricola]|uniref:DUF3515 domain-containing protein n=1 Tax=Microbacterium terricola TaxID=344163 RepID=UPI0021E90E67|nr:DUF3515 domain-containing protein [Microbacterium terricola]UYK41340.1 DUF3515 domain-containing protein [Microbacterium terricola]